MSTEIHLPGLLAREPAGAMASFGLYSLLPDATIRWERSMNSHYPVLMNGVAGVDHLKHILLNPKTWERLNLPPQEGRLNSTQCSLADYDALTKSDPEFAQGLGCDQLLNLKDEEKVVPRTPFYALYRGDANFQKSVSKLIGLLRTEDGDKLMRALLDPVWDMFPGPGFSLFPSATMSRAFKAPYEIEAEEDGESKSRTNPLVVLLAAASWRLFPAYKLGRKITATGWVDYEPGLTNGTDKKPCWVYPVFNRHTPRNTFLTWMLHPKLKRFRKNPAMWNAVGVESVYAFGWEAHPINSTLTIYYMLRGEQL